MPKPSKKRRVGEDGRAAIETGQLVVRHMSGREQPQLGPSRADELDRRGQGGVVLSRIVRREHEHVVAVAPCGPFGRESLVHTGVGDDDSLAREAESLGDVVRRERGDGHDHVAGAGRVRVLGEVLPARPRVHPLREAQRDQVVDDRRAQSSALARVHPVREVEDVERPGEALDRRGGPPGSRAVRQTYAEGGSVTRRRSTGMSASAVLEPLPREHAHGGEGDDLVLGPGRLGQPAEGAPQVVADPGTRVRERRCVDDDAHGGSP